MDVVVECNAWPAVEYERMNGRRPRLVAIHAPGREGLPGDIGHVADSLDADGSAVTAILVSEASAHPGAVVPARVLGLVRASGADSDWLVVAPAGGARAVTPAEDLPAEFHQRLQSFLGSDALEWVARDEAERLAREAIERGLRAQAQERAERASADVLWTPTPGTERRWAVFEGETHTQGEMDVLRIPNRFQLYVREVLLPRERFIQRAKAFGMTLREIHQLIEVPSADAPEQVRLRHALVHKLSPTEQRIAELETLRDELRDQLARLGTYVTCGHVGDCACCGCTCASDDSCTCCGCTDPNC